MDRFGLGFCLAKHNDRQIYFLCFFFFVSKTCMHKLSLISRALNGSSSNNNNNNNPFLYFFCLSPCPWICHEAVQGQVHGTIFPVTRAPIFGSMFLFRKSCIASYIAFRYNEHSEHVKLSCLQATIVLNIPIMDKQELYFDCVNELFKSQWKII